MCALSPQDYSCHQAVVRVSQWTTEFNFSMHAGRRFPSQLFSADGPHRWRWHSRLPTLRRDETAPKMGHPVALVDSTEAGWGLWFPTHFTMGL